MNAKIIAALVGVSVLGGGYAYADHVFQTQARAGLEKFITETREIGDLSIEDVSASLFSQSISVHQVGLVTAGHSMAAEELTFAVSNVLSSPVLTTVEIENARFDIPVGKDQKRALLGITWAEINIPAGITARTLEDFTSAETMPSFRAEALGLEARAQSGDKARFEIDTAKFDYDNQTGMLDTATLHKVSISGGLEGQEVAVSFAKVNSEGVPVRAAATLIREAKNLPKDTADSTISWHFLQSNLADPTILAIDLIEVADASMSARTPDGMDIKGKIGRIYQKMAEQPGMIDRAEVSGVDYTISNTRGMNTKIALNRLYLNGYDMVASNEFNAATQRRQLDGTPIPADVIDTYVKSAENLFSIKAAELSGFSLVSENKQYDSRIAISLDRVGLDDITRDGDVVVNSVVSMRNFTINHLQKIDAATGDLMRKFDLNDLTTNMVSQTSYDPVNKVSHSRSQLSMRDFASIDTDVRVDLTSVQDFLTAGVHMMPTNTDQQDNAAYQARLDELAPQLLASIEDADVAISLNNETALSKLLGGYAAMTNGQVTVDQLKAALPLQLTGLLTQSFPVLNAQSTMMVASGFFNAEQKTLALQLGLQDGKSGKDLLGMTAANMADYLSVSVSNDRLENIPQADPQ